MLKKEVLYSHCYNVTHVIDILNVLIFVVNNFVCDILQFLEAAYNSELKTNKNKEK
jgi:hypothetical protein